MVTTMKKCMQYTMVLLVCTLANQAWANGWPQAPGINAKSWILMDAQTNQVLGSEDANHRLPPASLTKIMTLYLLFEDLKLGRLHKDETVRVSEKAWKIGGSTMFIEPRMTPTVNELLHGISTLSGNDACIAMAEHVAGSEEAFAERMNKKAQTLGLKNSHFSNATGFPADDHYSSAADMAALAAALWRDFPEEYKLFSEKSFTFDGRTQWNRNRLLWTMPEVDGLKTGHTEEAGYCLVASAQRDNTRLISAVFGTDSDKARQQESRILLKFGFRNFVTLRPAERDLRRQVPVWAGKEEHAWLKSEHPIWVTIPKGFENKLSFLLHYETPLMAPLKEGQQVGSIDAVIKQEDGSYGQPIASANMVAARDVEEASWIGRRIDLIKLWWEHTDAATEQDMNATN